MAALTEHETDMLFLACTPRLNMDEQERLAAYLGHPVPMPTSTTGRTLAVTTRILADRESAAPSAYAAVETHNDLRERAFHYLKAHPVEALFGDGWLATAIDLNDITALSVTEDGLVLHGEGTTHTNQTMSHEPFTFEVPMAAVTNGQEQTDA